MMISGPDNRRIEQNNGTRMTMLNYARPRKFQVVSGGPALYC
jgi:hypothetical protein